MRTPPNTTATSRPGGSNRQARPRRVGSPNTHHLSGETTIMDYPDLIRSRLRQCAAQFTTQPGALDLTALVVEWATTLRTERAMLWELAKQQARELRRVRAERDAIDQRNCELEDELAHRPAPINGGSW